MKAILSFIIAVFFFSPVIQAQNLRVSANGRFFAENGENLFLARRHGLAAVRQMFARGDAFVSRNAATAGF